MTIFACVDRNDMDVKRLTNSPVLCISTPSLRSSRQCRLYDIDNEETSLNTRA